MFALRKSRTPQSCCINHFENSKLAQNNVASVPARNACTYSEERRAMNDGMTHSEEESRTDEHAMRLLMHMLPSHTHDKGPRPWSFFFFFSPEDDPRPLFTTAMQRASVTSVRSLALIQLRSQFTGHNTQLQTEYPRGTSYLGLRKQVVSQEDKVVKTE